MMLTSQYLIQIADDVMTMKSRHLEMVQELEENFLIASRENQVQVREILIIGANCCCCFFPVTVTSLGLGKNCHQNEKLLPEQAWRS